MRQSDATLGDVHAWRALARPEQTPPEGDWAVWYLRGGRGGGKTWTGSHVLAEWAWDYPGEYGILAPTYASARDTCVEGASGILAALGTDRAEVDRGTARYVESWNRSLGELRLRNGSAIWVSGADVGGRRMQGHNLRGAWADEIGLWRRPEVAWDQSLRYAVRMAPPARIVATGTPKRGHPLVRALITDPAEVKTLVRTLDNVANLDAATVDAWVAQYAGTALGRQELEGEMLEDVPGALWQRRWIDADRLLEHPDLVRVVVGVDPEASSAEGAAETGILVVGAAPHDGHGAKPMRHDHYYVLEDASLRATPDGWGRAAVTAYKGRRADLIVAEANNGGEMVEHTLRTVESSVSFKAVHASRGKVARAEPIAALYEQGCVHHLGVFTELEDQLCSYVGGDGPSPDRYDALVWALTELAVKDEPGLLTMYRDEVARRVAAKAAGRG